MKKRKGRHENPIDDPYSGLMASILYRALLDYIGIFYSSESVLACSLLDVIATELWLRKSPWCRTILDYYNLDMSSDEFVNRIHKHGIWIKDRWVKRSPKLDKLCLDIDLDEYLYITAIAEYSNMSIDTIRELIRQNKIDFITVGVGHYMVKPIEMIRYKIAAEQTHRETTNKAASL